MVPSMSILDRLNLLVRSQVGSRAPSSAEVREALEEAVQALGILRREEQHLARRYHDVLDRITSAEADASAAIERGDDVGASAAIKDKESLDLLAAEVRLELESHRTHLTSLRETLHAMSASRRGSAEPNTDTAGFASHRAGESGFSFGDDATERFDEMSSRIDAMEAETSAEAELSDSVLLDPDGARLEREFQALGDEMKQDKQRCSESALERLRRTMNEEGR